LKKVLVNGVLFEGNHIHEPDAVVEIFFNLEDLQIYLPRQVIVYTNSKNLQVHGEHVRVLIRDNTCNISLFSDRANVTVEQNSANVKLFGDYSAVSILGNSANLHVFGDFIKTQIEDCGDSPQLHGNNHEVEIKKGSVVVYGNYATTTVNPGAEAIHFGDPYKIINLPETP